MLTPDNGARGEPDAEGTKAGAPTDSGERGPEENPAEGVRECEGV